MVLMFPGWCLYLVLVWNMFGDHSTLYYWLSPLQQTPHRCWYGSGEDQSQASIAGERTNHRPRCKSADCLWPHYCLVSPLSQPKMIYCSTVLRHTTTVTTANNTTYMAFSFYSSIYILRPYGKKIGIIMRSEVFLRHCSVIVISKHTVCTVLYFTINDITILPVWEYIKLNP